MAAPEAPPRVVLITGASGFLGAAVARFYRGQGAIVRTFQRPDGGSSDVDERVVLPTLLDPEAIRAGLNGVDTVIHLAARVHQVQDTATDPAAEFKRINVGWTEALARAAIAAGVQRFFFASSVKAVGEQRDLAYNDATMPQPQDAYGLSKREAEMGLMTVLAPTPVQLRMLRFPLMYGPGVRANMLKLFQAVDRGWPIPVGGIANRRSILFLENAVSAIAAALTSAIKPSPYLISDGAALTSEELVRLIAESLEIKARVVSLPIGLLRAGAHVGDLIAKVLPFPLSSAAVDRLTGSLTIDDSGFRGATGWQPPFSTRQGLAATAAWYRQQRA